MSKLICLLNHTLTSEQIQDAFNDLEISSILYAPSPIKELWSNIPTGSKPLSDFLNPIILWLKSIAEKGDYLLVQGDFGATYLIVRFAITNCLIPVYSTTERVAKEEVLADGSVKLNHIFQHRGFRIYGV